MSPLYNESRQCDVSPYMCMCVCECAWGYKYVAFRFQHWLSSIILHINFFETQSLIEPQDRCKLSRQQATGSHLSLLALCWVLGIHGSIQLFTWGLEIQTQVVPVI